MLKRLGWSRVMQRQRSNSLIAGKQTGVTAFKGVTVLNVIRSPDQELGRASKVEPVFAKSP
ncbi:hypothetical protein [Moorena sp. SIO3H5]|uniref:hypothetical protein n=1 Tax=Moorena sp. SIO3H5 TaxID=2607834 RepID=UPI0013BC778B|nr:hypothetical protein [Moorena sp. SIO3H5]NEO72651.1 hypothetical protein [Moorena sp. SIO3H5]